MIVRNREVCMRVCAYRHSAVWKHTSTTLHKDNCISARVAMTIKTRIDVFNPAERIKLISRPIPCDISVFVLRFSILYRAICLHDLIDRT